MEGTGIGFLDLTIHINTSLRNELIQELNLLTQVKGIAVFLCYSLITYGRNFFYDVQFNSVFSTTNTNYVVCTHLKSSHSLFLLKI